tara:strand:+ start:165 stop:623 length:459 start_codon:yes stop_codon:yes gene_type:complete
MTLPKINRQSGFTLLEVLIAVVIFVFAIGLILVEVSQSMGLVRSMQEQRPDLGALAGKTLIELPAPDGELASGLSSPVDEDFGGNGGGELALYPDAQWQRDLFAVDATNGLYQASILVNEINRDGTDSDYELRFLMFRPDLAEAELSGSGGR